MSSESELRRRPNAESSPGSSPYQFLVADDNNAADEASPPSTPPRNPKVEPTGKSPGFNFFGLFTPPRKEERSLPPAKNTHILVEVVAAQNLCPITDLLGNKANDLLLADGAGNAYATIRMAGRGTSQGPIIHKTRPARQKTLSPIWTVRSSSLYLLVVNDKEFELSGGLTFEVLTGRGALLPFSHGKVTVPPECIFDGNGERVEFRLKGGTNAGKDNASEIDESEEKVQDILALRFRRATDEDLKFMLAVQPSKDLREMVKESSRNTPNAKKPSTETDEGDDTTNDAFDKKLFLGGPADFQFRQDRPPRGHRTVKTAKQLNLVEIRGGAKGDEAAEKEQLLRVQPYPDEKRAAETTWLSEKEIEAECMSPSKTWIKAGGGDFGTLYVEILRCDGLPNLDQTVPPTGDKTDAFAAVLFEDTLVRTDVIFDRLSPRWLPWSMRAFAFNIAHPTSPLMLGVFDYDEGPMNAHDPIGRVVINMSQFECDTVYQR